MENDYFLGRKCCFRSWSLKFSCRLQPKWRPGCCYITPGSKFILIKTGSHIIENLVFRFCFSLSSVLFSCWLSAAMSVVATLTKKLCIICVESDLKSSPPLQLSCIASAPVSRFLSLLVISGINVR